MNGWIKLYRSLLNWEWHADPQVLAVFIYLLLMASTEDKRWQGVEVKRGSLVASQGTIAAGTGLSVQQVRTALKKLRSTGEVTVEQHPKFGVYTIKNYGLYQDDNRQSNSQTTDDQQAINRQATTSKEYKNIRTKEEKKEESVVRFAPPTLEAVRQYCLERKNRVDPQRFVDYYEANGWRVGRNPMRDWKAAVRSWETNGRDTSRRQVGPNGVELTGETTDILDGIL